MASITPCAGRMMPKYQRNGERSRRRRAQQQYADQDVDHAEDDGGEPPPLTLAIRFAPPMISALTPRTMTISDITAPLKKLLGSWTLSGSRSE
jgi:hypothetical protein